MPRLERQLSRLNCGGVVVYCCIQTTLTLGHLSYTYLGGGGGGSLQSYSILNIVNIWLILSHLYDQSPKF